MDYCSINIIMITMKQFYVSWHLTNTVASFLKFRLVLIVFCAIVTLKQYPDFSMSVFSSYLTYIAISFSLKLTLKLCFSPICWSWYVKYEKTHFIFGWTINDGNNRVRGISFDFPIFTLVLTDGFYKGYLSFVIKKSYL